jgi:hypothetical protein
MRPYLKKKKKNPNKKWGVGWGKNETLNSNPSTTKKTQDTTIVTIYALNIVASNFINIIEQRTDSFSLI